MTLQRILGAAALTLVITAASAAAMSDPAESRPAAQTAQVAASDTADPIEAPIDPGG